jgi:VWFA-related protein
MLRSHNARNQNFSLPCARIFPCTSIIRLLAVAAISITISQAAAIAQEPAQDDVVRVRTDLVTVPALVLDRSDHRVTGFSQDDFVVRVDGKLTQLDHFSIGTDRVALAFLLDASGSANEYLVQQRDAAVALFSRFGPRSEVAVLRFNESAVTAVPFTADVAQVKTGFSFPAFAEHHTAIFDSAMSALRLFKQRKSNPTERRIIILTSDGLDTASRTTAAGVIETAVADNVSFYVINFPIFVPSGGHLVPRPPAKGFRELAEKTGGHYFIAGDVKSALDPNRRYDLAPIFKAIEDDLAGQYLLGFYPDEASRNSQPHRIEVQLKAANNRTLRVKSLRESYVLNKPN